MRNSNRIALLAGMIWCLGVQAEIINIQEAIEASDLRVSVETSGRGYVDARSCLTCKSTRLEITPATIISIDGRRVSAGKNISRHWSGGVVIYEVETKQVVKLKL